MTNHLNLYRIRKRLRKVYNTKSKCNFFKSKLIQLKIKFKLKKSIGKLKKTKELNKEDKKLLQK